MPDAMGRAEQAHLLHRRGVPTLPSGTFEGMNIQPIVAVPTRELGDKDMQHPGAVVLKVRGGANTYIKTNGKVGTAGKGPLQSEEVTFTLTATQDQTLFQWDEEVQEDKPEQESDTRLEDGGGYVVRRLMPIECERLQGFPDGHTDLTGADPDEILARMPQYAEADEKGKKAIERKVRKWCKECPDGPRYKAIGNSFAVPVVRWIGERVQTVDEISGRGDAPFS